MAIKLALLFVLSLICVESFYIAGDPRLAPMNVQVYKGDDNLGFARLTRQNMDYTRTARVQPESVIVMPSQVPGYGAYGTSRGPTVVVNMPDQFNRVTDQYRRY